VTLNWSVAHRMTMMIANQAHRDLGIARDDHVDVFAALRAAGICCLAQPFPNLAGAYAGPEANGPAVMLNSRMDEITMRHTAGHELGHHVLGHGSTVDEDIDPDGSTLGGSWPDTEKLAEAFAAWFLMPLPAVEIALRRSGLSKPTSPADVHQVACWLGTSFAGTARHLVNLRKARAAQAEAWTRSWYQSGPKIRSQLSGSAGLPAGRVWTVSSHADGAGLHVLPGDTLIFEGGQISEPLPRGLERLDVRQLTLEPRDAAAVTEELTVAAELAATMAANPGDLTITLIPAPVRLGRDDAWRTRSYD
jgi:hypothetical protein